MEGRVGGVGPGGTLRYGKSVSCWEAVDGQFVLVTHDELDSNVQRLAPRPCHDMPASNNGDHGGPQTSRRLIHPQ